MYMNKGVILGLIVPVLLSCRESTPDEAEQIVSAARVEASEMLAEARNTAAEKVKAIEEKAVTDAAVLKERKASVAALEARKKILAAKQEMIEECFSEAEKAFSALMYAIMFFSIFAPACVVSL